MESREEALMYLCYVCNVVSPLRPSSGLLLRPISMSIAIEHNKLWDWALQTNDDFINVVEDATHFEVDLDAKYFSPKEIKVRTMGDLLQIQMEHDERDNGAMDVNRSISRCYKLPVGVNVQTLKSNLTRKGILHITGQKV
ncbi:unnamed protein product [Cylicocyclus nassatus]|uniref:SHSP domain-containing protein n=1 Tax=Cylicocyclus nassatus TaxID=53992 RepID=A0AA36M9Z9_CYLNA|nr:unnamed protein product [Cylicocyclus nassatus]